MGSTNAISFIQFREEPHTASYLQPDAGDGASRGRSHDAPIRREDRMNGLKVVAFLTGLALLHSADQCLAQSVDPSAWDIGLALMRNADDPPAALDHNADGQVSVDEIVRVLSSESFPTSRPPGTRQTITAGPSIEVGSGTGMPGDQTSFQVTFHSGGFPVAGLQNDLSFGSATPILPSLRCSGLVGARRCTTDAECGAFGRCQITPDCDVNVAINKNATNFSFQPPGCSGAACTGMRAIVFDFLTVGQLIPDAALLYTCHVQIAGDASPGPYPLRPSNVIMSDAAGNRIPGVTGSDGAIVVEPDGCTVDGDCDDGSMCTTDTCDASGTCIHQRANEGLACDSGTGTCLDGTCVPLPVSARADLEVYTACRPEPACPHDTVNCDVHVFNRGPSPAPRLTVRLDLTGDLQLGTSPMPLKIFAANGSAIGMSPAPIAGSQQVEWVLAADVPPGGKAATWFVLDVGAAGGTKVVSASSAVPDPNPANNVASEAITPDGANCPPAAFAMKSVGPAGPVCALDRLSYMIVFQHPGAATADVVDDLDPCFDPNTLSALLPQPECSLSGNTITCAGVPLDARGRGQVSFAVKPRLDCPIGSLLLNQAAVTFDDGFQIFTNPTASEVMGCEQACGDGVDNDGDGATDCEDSDCQDRPCDDGDLCTTATVCNMGTCTDGTGCDACQTCDPSMGCLGAPCPTGTLGGTLTYYSNGEPVPGTTLVLGGFAGGTTHTDATGSFVFAGMPWGDYSLEPRKQGEIGRAVSALDAAHALQSVLGLRGLTAAQALACDVTGNGMVSALDASRILQYVVGLIPRLPVAERCGSDWVFLPAPNQIPNRRPIPPVFTANSCQLGGIAFEPMTGVVTDADFQGIAFGDCTGNWTAPGSGSGAASTGGAAIRIGAARRGRGKSSRIPLFVEGISEIQAAEIDLAYDAAKLRARRVRALGGARKALLSYATTTPGVIRIALAQATPIANSGTAVLAVDFDGQQSSGALRVTHAEVQGVR
jgi:hypothetical protein